MLKRMISLTSVVVLAMFCLVTPMFADTLEIGDAYKIALDGPGSGTNQGGPFYVTETDGTMLFKTFCIERNENAYVGTVVLGDPSLTKEIVNGGNDANPMLNFQTDWLYAQFDQTTAVWDDWVDAEGLEASNIAMQLAIWQLEGEYVTPFAPYTGNALAQEMVQAAMDNAEEGMDYGTVVLNWQNRAGEDKQSMLYNPVPEPSMILLLGIALSFFSVGGLLRKK